ncbi:hypothetical protein DH2020_001779 [Rehmannia glutinosa]|uniref:Uncharacterized protein n=1 Tax=Rehmannia glutinosa TaxID=99300 RepID=A0ABR0XS78_REHGL
MHNLIGIVPHRALHHLALKYGPLMHLQLGELSAVVVSSPDAAKQVMKTHDLNFASRPPIIVAEIISYGCTSISFAPYGDYWRQLRKICTLELLSMKRVQSFRSLRENVFLDLTRWIASHEAGSTVNLTEKLYYSTCDFTSRAVLGKKTKEHEKLLAIIKQVIELGAGFDIGDVYPSISLLQKMSGLRKRVMKLHQEADMILEDIINDHRILSNSTSDEIEKQEDDLVDVLLRFQADDSLQLPLTTDNIKAVIVVSNHFEYIPFGAGRRICPGISFGLANVELLLAMFLYHFDWSLPAGMKHEEMDMTEGFGTTTRRKNNLCVVPVLKRPLRNE